MRLTLLALLAALVVVTLADVPKCSSSLSVGARCHIKAYHIKPTQFAYGRVASQCKAEYLNTMSKSKLQEYMEKEKHVVPVIKGWDGEFYAIDHHHLARAFMDSDVSQDDQVMYADIIADLSHNDELGFWSKMIQSGYTWLFDERGNQPISPLHLPEDMGGLVNDYYRSLAFFVRSYGGFGKSNVSYAEFIWANWFRQELPLPFPTRLPPQLQNQAGAHTLFLDLPRLNEAPAAIKWNVCDVLPYETPCLTSEPAKLQSIFSKAMALAASPKASHLPGFGQGVLDPPHCDVARLEKHEAFSQSRNYKKRAKAH